MSIYDVCKEIDIIQSLHSINNAIIDTKYMITESYSNYIDKQRMIMENYEGDDLNSFSIFQEDAPPVSTPLVATDINIGNFDNSKIIKAIELINDARKEFMKKNEKTTFDVAMTKIVHSKQWKESMKCLSEQFDCHIHISHFLGRVLGDSTIPGALALKKKDIIISKSKGFQLSGAHILINIGTGMKGHIPKHPELFAQFIISVILHELFHNIAYFLRKAGNEIRTVTSSTVDAITIADNATDRRIIVQNYVNSLDDMVGIELPKNQKKKLCKQILKKTAITINTNISDDTIGNDNDVVEKYSVDKRDIKKLKKLYKNAGKKYRNKRIGETVYNILSIVYNIYGIYANIKNGKGRGVILNTLVLAMSMHNVKRLTTSAKDVNYEEYYCDLFAAMYKLPVVFKYNWVSGILSKRHVATANSFNENDLADIYKMEKEFTKLANDPHPSNSERNYASFKIAKQLLDTDKDLDPVIKKYLEWIVANFSNVQNIHIDEDHSERIFDPKEADDLDKHMNAIISNGGIALTESDLSWLYLDDSDVIMD